MSEDDLYDFQEEEHEEKLEAVSKNVESGAKNALYELATRFTPLTWLVILGEAVILLYSVLVLLGEAPLF